MSHKPITDAPDQKVERFAIRARNLSKRFNREWIFRGLNFEFAAGKVYAITGPNGSGKSTLLQVLWGQVPPTSGDIDYNNGGALLPADDLFAHISIAAPYMELIGEFTLMEHLEFHFRMKTIRDRISLSDLVDIMYLTGSEQKHISNFSSGMKQRLKLGMAMYTRADVLFLDEPGTNLDAQAFAWYKRELGKPAAQNTVIIASNNPGEYPPDALALNLLNYKKAGV